MAILAHGTGPTVPRTYTFPDADATILTNLSAIAESQITNLVADLAAKAPLASPALTGTPTAPTAANGTNTTQIATTAFVLANGGAVVQTTTSTGTQNDFALSAGATLLRANNATAVTLTGLTAGTDGQRLEIESVGAGSVTLTDQAAGSSAANRIITGVGGPLSLLAGSGTVRLVYDATTARWIGTSFPGVGQLRCSAFHSTTQSLTTGVVAACSLDSESFDVGALHDTVTNNSRFTIPAGGDGVYVAIGSVYFAGSGAGTGRFLYLAVNGAQVEVVGWPPNANNIRPQIVGTLSLVAGDYLQLWAYQDSGGALNIGAASPNQTRLSVIKVG